MMKYTKKNKYVLCENEKGIMIYISSFLIEVNELKTENYMRTSLHRVNTTEFVLVSRTECYFPRAISSILCSEPEANASDSEHNLDEIPNGQALKDLAKLPTGYEVKL